MTREELHKKRYDFIREHYHEIKSGKMTKERLSDHLNTSYSRACVMFNKMDTIIMLEQINRKKAKLEKHSIIEDATIDLEYEPQCVREFVMEKRIEVHPKRVDEVGGKIVLTYESRLNYE